MTIDDLRAECQTAGLMLHKCHDTHFQIMDSTGPLVDVWPTTNKYRWHGAAENVKAKNGSAHQAVKQALFSATKRQPTNGEYVPVGVPEIDELQKLPPRLRSNGQAKAETVNHPQHYTAGTMEVIDAIEGLQLGFHAGNVVKYVARYKLKGGVEDLKKARWYLERLISQESMLP